MDDEQLRRQRHALQSQIDVLSAAQRRLAEIIDDDEDHHHQTHYAQPAAHDDGHLAVVAGAAESSSGDQQQDPDDDLYPLLNAPLDAMQLDYPTLSSGPLVHGATDEISLDVPAAGPQAAATSALDAELEMALADGDNEYGFFYDMFDQQHQTPEDLDQAAAGTEEAGGGDHDWLLSGLQLYSGDNDDNMWLQQAPRVEPIGQFGDDDGFGGVPASAAAIAGLGKQRYDGAAGAGDDTCVICLREYKKGKRLYVMPCAFKHRFHRKCLKKWLSRSHLCPLCRHALPTEDTGDVHRTSSM